VSKIGIFNILTEVHLNFNRTGIYLVWKQNYNCKQCFKMFSILKTFEDSEDIYLLKTTSKEKLNMRSFNNVNTFYKRLEKWKKIYSISDSPFLIYLWKFANNTLNLLPHHELFNTRSPILDVHIWASHKQTWHL